MGITSLLDGSPPPGGALLIDKPAGISSHGVVARIRRPLGKGVRVGHTGTLDPFATGLMIVLVGRATRTAQFFSGLDKRYETLAQLGALSTTGDPEGEITVTGRVPGAPLKLPAGVITQTPPAYSAIKIGGERAYARARRGEDVEMPERTVEIHEFRELGRDDALRRVTLGVHCSTGTYVRSLVRDLGDAYCLALRRTAVGPHRVEDAHALDQLETRDAIGAALMPLDEALAFLPQLHLSANHVAAIRHGRRVPEDELSTPLPGGPIVLVDDEGIVAIGRAQDAQLESVVGLRA